MSYKRIHVRVPIQGEALLRSCKDTSIKARTIDISHGGVAISSPDEPLIEDSYDIIITFGDGKEIKLAAYLVRQKDGVLGFRTDKIDGNSLQVITDLVFAYQETTDFIKQIDEHNLFDQSFIDEEGRELDITFNVDLEKP
jgi:hypothetical protein